MSSAIIILAPLFVIVMIAVFVRNAIRLKRDVDRRFDDFRSRLEREAMSKLEPVLKEEIGPGRKSTEHYFRRSGSLRSDGPS